MPAADDKLAYPIQTLPGIKRDGTVLDGNYFSDGQWCRFRNGRPKKIGGYREVINLNSSTVAAHNPTTPVRDIEVVMNSPQVLAHAFHGQGITQIAMDQNGVGGSCVDRTPGGFASKDYVWTYGDLWDTTGGKMRVVCHAADSLADITSDVATPIYYATGVDTAAFTVPAGSPSVSGGVCVLQPFVFAFGSNGLIQNSDANKPATWTGGLCNTANVARSKIVAGIALRGASNSPSGLFWSLDALIRVSFVGGATLWRYDTITEDSSILSSKCVVEVDGVYYWPGVDRFLMFNGVVKELPNPINQDFFFDNLNPLYRNKVWGIKVARWGEIWWMFPKGDSTECNHAVIYNYRENTWYDTPISRSGGHPGRELPLFLMGDSQPNTASGSTGYRVFRHEVGVDSVIGENQVAIPSYFETSQFGFLTGGPGGQGAENPNVNTRVSRVEPDFKLVGGLSFTLKGKQFAMDSAMQESDPVDFTPGATESKVDFREQRRLPTLRVESNEQGGDYFMGKCLVHMEPGDERP